MEENERKKKIKKEMVATSLRIEREILDQIDDYGIDIERSRNWVVNKLLKQALENLK
ncbi:MAG: hypothetical protein NE334_06630 [Lentisphaeraceae bacterium]|nr:hypothetical protein [Lentisphaeraceae bacterium]